MRVSARSIAACGLGILLLALAPAPIGDLRGFTAESAKAAANRQRDLEAAISSITKAYGDGSIRVTPEQDLLFRWVNACDVRQLYRRLAAAGLGLAEAGTVADVTSCPGAETCRLAVTQSRGLGRLLEEHLRARPDLIAAADGDAGLSQCAEHVV